LTKDETLLSKELSGDFIESDSMKVTLDISDGQASLSIQNKNTNSRKDLRFDLRYWQGTSEGGQNDGAYIFRNEIWEDSRSLGNFTKI
jgi:hypothetical protein